MLGRRLQKSFKHRPKLRKSPGPMAQLMFDKRPKLAESFVIFEDQKERIVAKAALSAKLASDSASASGLGLGDDFAGRVRDGQSTNKGGAATVVGNIF